MNECRTRFPHAELPHRAAQVDHQEFEGLEDPGRSAFDADYQPALVVDREQAVVSMPSVELNLS